MNSNVIIVSPGMYWLIMTTRFWIAISCIDKDKDKTKTEFEQLLGSGEHYLKDGVTIRSRTRRAIL